MAETFPDEFAQLTVFAERHERFVNTTIARLPHEVEFILACLEFKGRMERLGLPMSYPTITEKPGLLAEGCYDAALAASGHAVGESAGMKRQDVMVQNSLELAGAERFVVVTGPNQGGKTTFARAVGQLHHLAALGCPVPAARSEVFLTDGIFVQFERQEDPGSRRGKLQDDLLRIRTILQETTPRSLVIMNEVFSSTSTQDALELGQRILLPLLRLGCLGVCVTFLEELASGDDRDVSMVADVDPDDPSVRLYTLSRRPPDGRAHAESLMTKYRLGLDAIKDRVAR